MSQDVPVTGYAILGLLTFGDELTGYEVKQRADVTLRFYWVSPAMSQIYTELRRLADHGLVRADSRADGGRDVTTYAMSAPTSAEMPPRRRAASGPAPMPLVNRSRSRKLRTFTSRPTKPRT